MKVIDGDLIQLALDKKFQIIAHGCNCFCKMGSGIAVPMAKHFGVDKFRLEEDKFKGDINKLGNIDCRYLKSHDLFVINAYTQYNYGRGIKLLSYEALTMCMVKINKTFPGLSIGLPLIGCGLAGGDWNLVEPILKKELSDMDVTVVRLPY